MYYLIAFDAWKPPRGNYDVKELLGIQREDVFFCGKDGKKLHAWFFAKPGAKYTAVLHHGAGGNLSCYLNPIELLLFKECSVFVYDYHGYGRSEGETAICNFLKDADAALEYLISVKKVKASEIINVGVSLGCGPASHAASTHGGKALILLSPYTSLYAVGRDTVPVLNLYPDWLFPEKDMGCSESFDKIKVPTIIYQAENDLLVKPWHGRVLQKLIKAPATLVELPEGMHDHRSWILQTDFQRALSQFSKKYL